MGHPVYISGPHGSGKTTLIEKLLKADLSLCESSFEIDFLKEFPTISYMTPYERCVLRTYHRLFVGEYNTRKEGNDIILVSRGIYDSIAYGATEYALGEMTKEEYGVLQKINALGIARRPLTIILNPPVDIILERLTERRKKGTRKERDIMCAREDTYEYVKLVHDELEKYKDNADVLYILDNDKDNIEKVLEWIHTRTKG